LSQLKPPPQQSLAVDALRPKIATSSVETLYTSPPKSLRQTSTNPLQLDRSNPSLPLQPPPLNLGSWSQHSRGGSARRSSPKSN
jgi:hypothetical protein